MEKETKTKKGRKLPGKSEKKVKKEWDVQSMRKKKL